MTPHRPLLLAGLAALVLIGSAPPAAAHPWGAPPEAEVEADGDRVVVRWQAEADDALLLGVKLGLVDPEQLDWDWDGPQAPADGALLPPAEPLEAYVLERTRVVQDGVACAGAVEPFTDLVADGVTTVHTCPRAVEVVQLEIRMLHDLHEAYRTFAEAEGDAQPLQAVFTAAIPTHRWAFGEAAAGGGYGAAAGQLASAALIAAGIAGLAVRRRLRRRRRSAPEGSEPEHRELVAPHGLAPLGLAAAAERPGFGWLESEFVKLIDLEQVGLVMGVVALVAAFAIGAAHALTPGHGKGLIGAYLVGTRGRPRDAVALGTIVAAMHCASVVMLGGVLFITASVRTDVAQVMPWMGVAAGVLITAVGIGLVARQVRIRAARRAAARNGVLVAHRREHGHSHELFDGGSLSEGVSPLSRRGLVALGVSGGLLPSPSAFLVLATAILMGRALFGFLLVAIFSVGLASTLTAFGLAAVKGRTILENRAATSHRLTRLTAALPLISSIAVLLGGFWVTTLALLRF